MVSRRTLNQRLQPEAWGPLLQVVSLRVLAVEEVAAPLRVGNALRVFGSNDMGLTAVGEFGLVSLPAPGTLDKQHLSFVGG